MPPHPPRFAGWLLDVVLPHGHRGDTIRGDLVEEYGARAATGSEGAARRWYTRQAIAIAIRTVTRMTPKVYNDIDLAPQKAGLMDGILTDLASAGRALRKA